VTVSAAQTSYADLAAYVWLALVVVVVLSVLCRLGRRNACVSYAGAIVLAFSVQLGGAG